MAKWFAQLHTSALDSCMPPIQICKAETMHREQRISGSPKHVNQHLIRKVNKTPSASLGKKKKKNKLFCHAFDYCPKPLLHIYICITQN